MIPLPRQYHETVSNTPESVLLETSRTGVEDFRSYLFVDPVRKLAATSPDEIPKLFQQIEECLRKGLFVAGYLAYECGYHFEPRSAIGTVPPGTLPLARFGVYRTPYVFDHNTGSADPKLPVEYAETSGRISDIRLQVTQEEYRSNIEAIREYIASGDTYQVNFTTRACFEYVGSPAAIFGELREQQRVSYAAYIHTGEQHIVSFSPELFFRIDKSRITTRPMKGTAPRGRTLREDNEIRKWLTEDLKNRSENVMIVDLLRSDLGKIALTGSVQVDELFEVEKYETLFQMTSTISAELLPNTSFYDIFRAIFPSGSVTGAPKCRTMQIIQELEGTRRGVYTGAIGYIAPDRSAVFNVPIRTAVMTNGTAEVGVGSGITYDSRAEQEYDECVLKLRFFSKLDRPFSLLESLRWSGEYTFLQQHLARLRDSAEYFDFTFRDEDILSALEGNERQLTSGEAYKVRLLLGRAGQITIDNVVLRAGLPNETIMIARERTSSQDKFLFHKTTNRELYERCFAEARAQGHEDVIFLNERDEVTEGSNNNLFVDLGGVQYTPPVECGLLPGVYRQHLLDTQPITSERVLWVEDLKAANEIYLCNSVRGLREVRLVE